ncbi:MAG: hypothetical protein ACRCZ9_05105 [Fusobacteriaceae bacterium]
MYIKNKAKIKFWILEKEAILKEYRNQLLGCYDEKPDYKLTDEEIIIFESINLLNNPALQEDGTLREATQKELYETGLYELHEGELFSGDKIVTKYDFEIPQELKKPDFDYEKLVWIETATQEEIEEIELQDSILFYNKELDLASKANFEYICNLITDEQIEEVKNYIIAIEPFKSGFLANVKRPDIFSRYN